jgi:hypothetical protein
MCSAAHGPDPDRFAGRFAQVALSMIPGVIAALNIAQLRCAHRGCRPANDTKKKRTARAVILVPGFHSSPAILLWAKTK